MQKVQNNAARIITIKRKFEHITQILKDLHWLPISDRITYKILVTTFKCLNGHSPGYLGDLLTNYILSRDLRSRNKSLLVESKVNSWSCGGRSILFATPNAWNISIEDIKEFQISQSI